MKQRTRHHGILLRALCALLLVLCCLFVPLSAATIEVFTSEDALLAAVSVANTTTFDSYVPGTSLGLGSAVVDEVVYEGSEPTGNWTVRDVSVLHPPSPPNVFGTGNVTDGHTKLSFGSGNSAEAVGFYMFHQTIYPVPAWDITVTDKAGAALVVPVSFGSPGFFGFVSTDGVVSVEIDDDPNDRQMANFWFDNVSRTAVVPEPSVLALLGAGAIALLVYVCLLHRHPPADPADLPDQAGLRRPAP